MARVVARKGFLRLQSDRDYLMANDHRCIRAGQPFLHVTASGASGATSLDPPLAANLMHFRPIVASPSRASALLDRTLRSPANGHKELRRQPVILRRHPYCRFNRYKGVKELHASTRNTWLWVWRSSWRCNRGVSERTWRCWNAAARKQVV